MKKNNKTHIPIYLPKRADVETSKNPAVQAKTAVSEVPEILEPGIAAGNCWEDHLTS